MKKFEFQLGEDIFHTAVYFILNKPFKRMVADIKRKFKDFKLSPDLLSSAQGITFEHYNKKDNLDYFFIYLPHFEWNIKSQGILAHEILHFVLYELKKKNIELVEPNEPACYLFEYYFVSALRQLGKRANIR
jgi:hypothetical protein